MKRSILIAVIVANSTIASARFAVAQFYPRHAFCCFGDAAGAAVLLSSGYHNSASMQMSAHSSMMQDDIRNTLSSEAHRRADALVDQGRANQDWFFQYQAQQMAQRQAAAYAAPTKPAPATPVSPGESNEAPTNEADAPSHEPPSTGPTSLAPSDLAPSEEASATPVTSPADDTQFSPRGGPPQVTLDVIQWPKVLQNAGFASERTQIEAPYRRTPPKLSVPKPADFRKMISIVEDMKSVLDWKLHDGMRTSEYNGAKAFLDALEHEATAHAGE